MVASTTWVIAGVEVRLRAGVSPVHCVGYRAGDRPARLFRKCRVGPVVTERASANWMCADIPSRAAEAGMRGGWAALLPTLERGVDNVRDIAEAASVLPRTDKNWLSSREQAVVATLIAETRIAGAVAERPAGACLRSRCAAADHYPPCVA